MPMVQAGRALCQQSGDGGDGLRTHPRLWLSIPLRQCGESGPPASRRVTMKVLGCVCAGLRAQWAKGLMRCFPFCPWTMSLLGLGLGTQPFPGH